MKKDVQKGNRPMWLVALTTFLVVTLAGMVPSESFTAIPDFSGTWKLNEGKSEFGEGRFRAAATMEVKQDKMNLNVTRVRTGRNGQERSMESSYSLDGKETTSSTERRSTTSTAKWSEDGKSLVIHSKSTFSRDGDTFEFTSDETWTLGDKGKTLSIQSKSSSSRGEFSYKAVYDLGE